MNKIKNFVVFSLDNQKFALYLETVEKIAQAAEILPLPKAPDIVMGVINVQGEIVPVVNIRKRFHMSEQEINVDDHFIIGKTGQFKVAILVDTVLDIIECSNNDIIEQGNIMPDIDYIDGVAKTKDGMMLIHDLNKFLSMDESKILNDAIQEREKNHVTEPLMEKPVVRKKHNAGSKAVVRQNQQTAVKSAIKKKSKVKSNKKSTSKSKQKQEIG